MDYFGLQAVATPCKNTVASAIQAPQSGKPGSDDNRQADQDFGLIWGT